MGLGVLKYSIICMRRLESAFMNWKGQLTVARLNVRQRDPITMMKQKSPQ